MEWITSIMELASASIRPVLLAALAVILLVDIVLFRAARKKIKELSKQLQNEEARIHEEISRINFEIVKEQDHRIKVLEGTVASQRESMAGLRDAVRTKAFDSSFTRGGTPDEIVAAAKKFERYLRGKE